MFYNYLCGFFWIWYLAFWLSFERTRIYLIFTRKKSCASWPDLPHFLLVVLASLQFTLRWDLCRWYLSQEYMRVQIMQRWTSTFKSLPSHLLALAYSVIAATRSLAKSWTVADHMESQIFFELRDNSMHIDIIPKTYFLVVLRVLHVLYLQAMFGYHVSWTILSPLTSPRHY